MSGVVVKFEMVLDEPSQDLLDYAKEHLNEDPDNKIQILDEFRNLIFEKGECSPHRLDDSYLLRFLRARRFIVRHAHRLLVNYMEFKEKNPEFYDNVFYDRLTAIGDAHLIMTQPFYDQSGRRILFYKLGLWDPEQVSVVELFQATLLTLELGLLETSSQILGGICIFDLGGIQFNHARHLTPKIAAKIIDIVVWTYPVRVHAIHIVNQSPIFKASYSIIKTFMNKETKERIFIHGTDMSSLHKHIHPNYLPERYGGTQPEYSYGEWVEYIKKTPEVLKELRDLGYTLEDQVFNK